MKPNRLFFYVADLMQLTGRKETYCRKVMKQIREQYQLKPHQQVTFYQVAEYYNVPVDKVYGK